MGAGDHVKLGIAPGGFRHALAVEGEDEVVLRAVDEQYGDIIFCQAVEIIRPEENLTVAFSSLI